MNVITAIVIVLALAMCFAFLVRIYSISKGKRPAKSTTSEFINVFAIIPRGLMRELRKVLKADLKSRERLNALINLILVALFLIASVIASIVLLLYSPFGGAECVVSALILFVTGVIVAAIVACISIHKVF